MTNDDKNNFSKTEENQTNYQHAASEIEALRAILKKRNNKENEHKSKEREGDNP